MTGPEAARRPDIPHTTHVYLLHQNRKIRTTLPTTITSTMPTRTPALPTRLVLATPALPPSLPAFPSCANLVNGRNDDLGEALLKIIEEHAFVP